MVRLVVVCLSVLALGAAVSAQSTIRTIAIADFVDESLDGAVVGAPRLNADLQQILASRGAGRVRVTPAEDVRATMRAQGVTARDLVSPTKAAALAQAVGADQIVTGRWLHLDLDVLTVPSPIDPTVQMVLAVWGSSLLEIRVLEAPTRRILLQDSVGGTARGFTRFGVLVQAAQIALQRAADRILDL